MTMTLHAFNYYRRSIRLFINKLLAREYLEKQLPITVEVSGLCNLNCVFCAYGDKSEGKQIMAINAFADHINQLVALGYDHICLTPQTGDVFIDKNFQEKLQFLEQHDGIKHYDFITNLISASHGTLDYIAKSRKLLQMYVSIYGRDSETFQKVTRRPHQQYLRLVDNLNYLAKIGPDFKPVIGAFTMAERGFKWTPSSPPQDDDSGLISALRRVGEKIPDFQWTGNHVDLDSWGGKILQADMDKLNMGFEIVGPTVPMYGPCGQLFGGFVILANGKVNACSCRAVDQSLIIGDTNTMPLHEIISPDNPVYSKILKNHQESNYPDTCKGCKIFSSIYRRPHKRETTTVDQFLSDQRARCNRLA